MMGDKINQSRVSWSDVKSNEFVSLCLKAFFSAVACISIISYDVKLVG